MSSRTGKRVLSFAFLALFPWIGSRSQTESPLPSVVRASVPFYPRLAPAARIQGTVTLLVTTDGRRISSVEPQNGPAMLAQAAKENLKTWEFEPHSPAHFQVQFHYKLLLPVCDLQCHCDAAEKESVLMQFPSNVEINAKMPAICDPAVPKTRK